MIAGSHDSFDGAHKSSLAENHIICSEVTTLSSSLSYQQIPESSTSMEEEYENTRNEVLEGTRRNVLSNSIDTIYCGKCLGTGILPVPPELKKFSSDTNNYDGNTLKTLIATTFLPSKDEVTGGTAQNNQSPAQSLPPPPPPQFGLAEIIEAENNWEITPREGQTYAQRVDAIEEKALRARECLEAQNQAIVNIAVIHNIDSILTNHIEETEVKWGILPPKHSSLDDRLLRIKEVAKFLRDGLETALSYQH